LLLVVSFFGCSVHALLRKKPKETGVLDKTIGILKMFVNRKLFLFVRAILDHPRLKIGLKAVMNGSS
jgi:hypothetical protein